MLRIRTRRPLMLLILALAATAGASAAAQTADEAAVLALEDRWVRAEIDGNEATLREVLHARFKINNNNATISDKEAAIRGVLAWDLRDQTLAERSATISGDTAVTFGTAHFRFADADGVEHTFSRRYTAVYVRIADSWQAIALHMSPRTE